MGISSASCHGPRLIANSGVLKVAQVAQLLQCFIAKGSVCGAEVTNISGPSYAAKPAESLSCRIDSRKEVIWFQLGMLRDAIPDFPFPSAANCVKAKHDTALPNAPSRKGNPWKENPLYTRLDRGSRSPLLTGPGDNDPKCRTK